MIFKPFAALLLLAASTSFAAEHPVDMSRDAGFAAKVEALASAYDLKQQVSTFSKHKEARAALGLVQDADSRPGDCEPSGPGAPRSSCVEAVCERIGKYNCDDLSEIQAAGEACRGNHNGECINAVCELIGKYNCDDLSEIRNAGQACRGVWNIGCINSVCERIGKYNCDDTYEINKVGAVCQGIRDVGCINSVCERLGRYNCDDLSELTQVAKSCK